MAEEATYEFHLTVRETKWLLESGETEVTLGGIGDEKDFAVILFGYDEGRSFCAGDSVKVCLTADG